MDAFRGAYSGPPSLHDPRLEQTLFGVSFPNPLGLAAGFDKNGKALDHWHTMGFGFVEAGTVTHLAQPGNPKPRMFRLPVDKALVNRLGFNNDGAKTIATRLAIANSQIPMRCQPWQIEGDGTGGCREGLSVELSVAACGVRSVFRRSTCPHQTRPGLGTLQEKGPLLEILSGLREVNAEKPLFVKVAPDLETSALDDVIAVAHEAKLTGLIATNTTLSREGLSKDPGQDGGLSGAPLLQKSNQFLSHLYASCDRSMVLIGVGGIMNGFDIYQKIRLGAHLCQLYTGWIYGGPAMISRRDAGSGVTDEPRRNEVARRSERGSAYAN